MDRCREQHFTVNMTATPDGAKRHCVLLYAGTSEKEALTLCILSRRVVSAAIAAALLNIHSTKISCEQGKKGLKEVV
jgi:hypothetical protein